MVRTVADPRDDGHILVVHEQPCETQELGRQCMFCDGGLSGCRTCGAAEGAWPDECPGERMSADQVDAVHAGNLNYRDGAWRTGECCQVMMPMHRREEFLSEWATRGKGQK